VAFKAEMGLEAFDPCVLHATQGGACVTHISIFTSPQQRTIIEALESLVLFPPDDTASNLHPGEPGHPNFPQAGHDSIKLGELFQTLGPE
jgi:hypothetical protein